MLEFLATRQIDFKIGAQQGLLEEQAQLDRKRNEIQNALAKLSMDQDKQRIANLHAEWRDAELEQQRLTERIQESSPHYAALQYPQPLDLAGAQTVLEARTLLLAYLVGEDRTYLFVVEGGPRGGQGLHVIPLSISGKVLRDKVINFRKQIQTRAPIKGKGEPIERLGKELYNNIVYPAQPFVKTARRLLICPDGPLQSLPFATLVTATKPTVRFLADEKSLHTIISTTAYAEIRRRAGQRHNQGATNTLPLLAFGDPIYQRSQIKSQRQATPAHARNESSKNTTNQTSLRREESQRAYLRTRGIKLKPLPSTRSEVEGIVKLHGPKARKYLGTTATEIAAKRESSIAAVIHFACEGVIDDQRPMATALALTQPDVVGRLATDEDNGLLQAWEIFEQMRLDADLVVLSACSTGLGRELRGEGIVGLSRAFLYAGANSVMVSLWNVEDESTAEWMKAFYRERQKRSPKDVAMQRATGMLRAKNPRWRHPYFWAPFVLIGD